MSSSCWIDPHFAALYARREEERLTERLVTRLRERAALEPAPEPSRSREPSWMEHEAVLGNTLRLR